MWTSGKCEKWGVRSGLVMSGVRSGAVMSSDVIVISEVWEVVWEVELWCDKLWWVVMRSCDVISELWEVRCEKWNCDELGCDKLWWVVIRSGPVRSGAVMSCDEQWSCDEWGVRSGAVMSWYAISDELWKEVDLSEVELWWVVMSSGAVMSEVWEVELWWVGMW